MHVDAGHLRVLERLGGGRTLYEVMAGPHTGAEVVGPDDPRAAAGEYWQLSPTDQRSAAQRADDLLDSMLDETQRDQRRRLRGAFWVDTSVGWLRLGQLYDLRLRPRLKPCFEESMCVVPAGWHGRRPPVPTGDVWVNLLLMALHAPEDFRRVAIVHNQISVLKTSDRPCDVCGSAFSPCLGGWCCRRCIPG